ncbi:hypothetical protein EUTSA_v10000390mg [Eutrema salsugineum]|uniref:Uncharacterized protein n=1 Tax=Eutrema salsugineum TaxID=72664 RepID=V4NK22_EUTSA|nr:hypothetical protein EUTSA_v10000390mg [Eutrema salsugineum]
MVHQTESDAMFLTRVSHIQRLTWETIRDDVGSNQALFALHFRALQNSSSGADGDNGDEDDDSGEKLAELYERLEIWKPCSTGEGKGRGQVCCGERSIQE